MKKGPLDAYRMGLAVGDLQSDPAQAYAAEQLQLLANRLGDWHSSRKRRVLNLLLGSGSLKVPSGLYLFGDVGRGKTMLMDLFYEYVDFPHKRRVHFHPFMRDVHVLIKEVRAGHEGDPIPQVADRIMQNTSLLCLDELHVNDITDAMILGRLFTSMFEQDLVVVATSNSAPRDLYKDGLNRQLFVPFIELVEERMEVLQLDAQHDYRYDNYQSTPHSFTPINDSIRAQVNQLWFEWAGHVPPHGGAIEVGSRRIEIPRMGGGMARFSFADLCARPLGTHDYLALCEHFHTFFIDDIPQLSKDRHNEARRFIALIDTLYDQKRRLIASSMVEPEDIYVDGPGVEEFARTASRLSEMRQSKWPDVAGAL